MSQRMSKMAEPRKSSIHLKTTNLAEFLWSDPQTEVDYPSAWFNQNPGSKPPVKLPVSQQAAATVLDAVRGGIHSSGLTMETVKVFLRQYGVSLTATLTTKWESYGVIIGEEGATVTPLSCLTIRHGNPYVSRETTCPPPTAGTQIQKKHPSQWTTRAMALYIFCVYRLARVTNPDYLNTLKKRMTEVLIAEGGDGMSLDGTSGMYATWLADPDFLRLVAAFDMFFHRFREHSDSILRLGTLGSRFKDCAGLLSVGYAIKILGIGAGELMDWIFVSPMGDEMLKLTKGGEESGDQYSFFPYQSEMGFVSRSAYSSNANPHLFTWIHIIGSLLGHRRSQNARFFFEGNFADLGLNAVLVAWAHSRGGELRPQFAGDGVDYSIGLEDDTEDVGGDDHDGVDASAWVTTTGRAPETWYALVKTSGYKVPKVVQTAIKRQRGRIVEVRESSVGEYVRDRFLY